MHSWGHAELPEKLVTDPCSLKVQALDDVEKSTTACMLKDTARRYKSCKPPVKHWRSPVAAQVGAYGVVLHLMIAWCCHTHLCCLCRH